MFLQVCTFPVSKVGENIRQIKLYSHVNLIKYWTWRTLELICHCAYLREKIEERGRK